MNGTMDQLTLASPAIVFQQQELKDYSYIGSRSIHFKGGDRLLFLLQQEMLVREPQSYNKRTVRTVQYRSDRWSHSWFAFTICL